MAWLQPQPGLALSGNGPLFLGCRFAIAVCVALGRLSRLSTSLSIVKSAGHWLVAYHLLQSPRTTIHEHNARRVPSNTRRIASSFVERCPSGILPRGHQLQLSGRNHLSRRPRSSNQYSKHSTTCLRPYVCRNLPPFHQEAFQQHARKILIFGKTGGTCRAGVPPLRRMRLVAQ